MSELRKLGAETTIIGSTSNHLQARSGSARLEGDLGVNWIWLKTPNYRKSASVSRLVSWLVYDFKVATFHPPASRPDVIIASSPSVFTLISGLVLARRMRAKFVPEIRDLWPLTGYEEYRFSRLNPLMILFEIVEKLALKMADGAIGMVPGFARYLSTRTNTPPTSVVIELGIERNSTSNSGSSLTSDRQPKGPLRIAYAGSIGHTNNLVNLLEAAREVEGDGRFDFRIYGQGDQLELLRKSSSNLSNVTFFGQVSRSEVARNLENCDVLYFGCLDSEVWDFGQSLNKVVEYMSAGKPIVAAFGGQKSMIDEADCGFFVEPENPAALAATFRRIASMRQEHLEDMGRRGLLWLRKNRSYGALGRRLYLYLQSI